MDLRLENGAVFQIVGPSGSGKTHFVSQLLYHADYIFASPIQKIYWLDGIDDDDDPSKALKMLERKLLECRVFKWGGLISPRNMM